MKEEDVRKTYKILGHEQETEIRLIDPEIDPIKRKLPISLFVNSEDEFVAMCKKYEGNYNIYVGIHERKTKGTDQKDVISVSAIIIDVDPIRPKGLEKQASREEEVEDARKIAEAIVRDCVEIGDFLKPSLAFSGNGFHVWFKIPKIIIDDLIREDVEQRIKRFIKIIQNKYDTPQVKIDQIGDLPRIIKIIGTKSIKGIHSAERPHRESYWIHYEPLIDEDLKDELLSYEFEEVLIKNYVEPSKKNLQEIRKIFSEPKYQRLFEGDIKGFKSRSEAEMSIINKLVFSQVPKDQVFEIMQSCRIGKWNLTPPQYRERTYEKAVIRYQQVQEQDKDDKIDWKQLAWNTAKQILAQYYFISYGEKERSIIYIYEDGTYQSHGKQRIRQIIHEILQEKSTLHVKNEIIEQIYSETITKHLPECSPEILCLENGILNVITREFRPHDPKTVLFEKVPVKYLPTSVCPNIEKFLKEVLNPEDSITIKKWIGYCLLKDYRFHNIVMLNGGGANGKSTFLSLMKNFLGINNVCSIPIQQLETDRFSLVLLKNKLANIFADLPSSALSGTSRLKGLTGEDNFSADQKFKEFMDFVNYAKFMYSCNELPIIPEDTAAIWRRLILIEFPNTFPKDKQDAQLLKKLAVPSELSGFLNYGLDGLKQLIIDNGFQTAEEKTREIYIRKTDSVGSFVLDCLQRDTKTDTVKEELYSIFVEYCELRGYDIVHESQFFKRLRTRIACYASYPKIDGRRTHCFRGVILKRCDMCNHYYTTFGIKGCNDTNHIGKFDETPNGKKIEHPTHYDKTDKINEKTKQHLVPSSLKESLLNIIQSLKQNKQTPISFEHFKEWAQNIPEEEFEKTIQQMLKDGDIFEEPVGHYQPL